MFSLTSVVPSPLCFPLVTIFMKGKDVQVVRGLCCNYVGLSNGSN